MELGEEKSVVGGKPANWLELKRLQETARQPLTPVPNPLYALCCGNSPDPQTVARLYSVCLFIYVQS